MHGNRFVILSPDKRHAICFEKRNPEHGTPGFYLAYPKVTITDGHASEAISEAGMELPEAHIKAMISFLQECLPVFAELQQTPSNVIPFRKP